MMDVAIVGCGKLGGKVAEALADGDYEVTLIDKNDEALERLAQQLDVMTVNEDARKISVLEELGIEMVVFGSGAARRLPDDMSESEGYKLLSQFLRMAASIAERHLITIAIEPLRAEECNIINFVSDAQRLAAMTMRVNVGALADLYHMMSGGDYYDELENGIGIIHAHIAEERYRSFPKKEDPCYPEYEEFFISLKRAGYEGRVSIEGHANDFVIDAKEAYEALDPLRR